MSDKEARPIRFFCKVCGKEVWVGMNYSLHENDTLGEMLHQLECSDCLLKRTRIRYPE